MSKKKSEQGPVTAPAVQILTPEEIGEIYKVSGKTVREWHAQGLIPAAVAVGRVLRFDREEVDEALRADACTKQMRKHGKALVI